jgi:curved DNA-binding protein
VAKSLYETLGISESASQDEIKKAYRRLARKYHPDICKESNCEEKFKEINAAYEILSDPQKKAQYDRMGDSMFGGQSLHDFAGSHGDVDLDEILRNIFGGAGGFGGFSSGGFSSRNSGGFSGFGGGFGGYSEPELDVEAKITIAFNTAVLGGKHSVNYNGESFDIKIPAGIKNGEKLRVKGKGKSYNARKGDLYLVVNVASSPEYERDENDLIKEVEVSLKKAIFGGKVGVKTLYKNITIKVPAGIKNGQKLRVKEQGVVNRKTKKYGDLYLKLNIKIPKANELDPQLAKMCEEKLPS